MGFYKMLVLTSPIPGRIGESQTGSHYARSALVRRKPKNPHAACCARYALRACALRARGLRPLRVLRTLRGLRPLRFAKRDQPGLNRSLWSIM